MVLPKEVMKNGGKPKMEKRKPVKNRKAIKKAKLRNIISYHHLRRTFSKFNCIVITKFKKQ